MCCSLSAGSVSAETLTLQHILPSDDHWASHQQSEKHSLTVQQKLHQKTVSNHCEYSFVTYQFMMKEGV